MTFDATAGANQFGGQLFHQLADARPDAKPFDRTVIDPMGYAPLRDAIAKTGRKKLLVGGLWTDSCVTLPVLSALREGYEVHVLVDASGDMSEESHEMAVQRTIKAGAIPVTWLSVMLVWQGDGKHRDTAAQMQKIAQGHGGARGQAID